jgi:hypothetical protein
MQREIPAGAEAAIGVRSIRLPGAARGSVFDVMFGRLHP